MAVEFIDGVDGGSIRRNADGFELTRVALVKGVTGNAEQRMYRALTDPGLPAFNTAHPTIPDVRLLEMDGEAISSSQVRVTLVYRVPSADEADEAGDEQSATVTISSTTVDEETSFDASGNIMLNQYSGPFPNFAFGVTASKLVTANVIRPKVVVKINRAQRTAPGSLITGFVGRVNSKPWSGYPAKTWLCSGITGERKAGQWDTAFEFSYSPSGWQITDILEINGAPVPVANDISTGRISRIINGKPSNGIATFDVYKEADFNQTGVSF